jgi:regulator of sigma E protease
MELFAGLWNYVVPFLVLLTVLVFVHELGHYLVARRCGVRVEVFSVGFGPELYGWTDRAGTRWRVSAVPIGGYVKMFGEQRSPDAPEASPEEQRVMFHNKPLGHRAAIVFAGPFANFVLAVVILAGMFMVVGQPSTPADIGQVVPGSAAERAGFKPGDVIVAIDGSKIERFEEVQRIVQMAGGQALHITVERAGKRVVLTAVPDTVETVDRFGNKGTIGRLGVSRTGTDMRLVRHDPLTAVWLATVETYGMTTSIFDALGQIISGRRTAEELGGPIRIAQMSGQMAQEGLINVLMFAAILSVNLGLINLFPIPMLDGGHLLFYLFEAVRGRPLGERAQEYGFRIGIALVLALMIFATWNDLVQLRVFDYLANLAT